MRTLLPCIVALSVASLAGCQVEHTQPIAQVQAPTAAEKDFQAVWQASRQMLREYRFQLDRQDPRAGVITTLPMTGMHFFELWRKDAARPADFGESTIQTIYRTAQVTVRPVQPDATTYQAQVEVFLRRSNRPAPQVTSTSEAYSLFSAGDRRGRRDLLLEQTSPQRVEDVTDLGNDRSLEAKLTADIAAAADRLRGVRPGEEAKPEAPPEKAAEKAPGE